MNLLFGRFDGTFTLQAVVWAIQNILYSVMNPIHSGEPSSGADINNHCLVFELHLQLSFYLFWVKELLYFFYIYRLNRNKRN